MTEKNKFIWNTKDCQDRSLALVTLTNRGGTFFAQIKSYYRIVVIAQYLLMINTDGAITGLISHIWKLSLCLNKGRGCFSSLIQTNSLCEHFLRGWLSYFKVQCGYTEMQSYNIHFFQEALKISQNLIVAPQTTVCQKKNKSTTTLSPKLLVPFNTRAETQI